MHRPVAEVFPFFADPANLGRITPPWMQFRIVECSTPEIGEGTEIEYALKVRGLPMRWRSLIRCWQPPFRFIDEQIWGPYRRWVHLHTFEDLGDRTRIRDEVDYAVPGAGWCIAHVVRPDLERIFAYQAVLAEKFADS
ncbi:MAG: SRPBCC family protein [Planctomycetota bacterium]